MKDKYYYDMYFKEPTGSSRADQEFTFRLNFFFTKLRQKETALQFIFKDDFYGVYFSHTELEAIFGNKNYIPVIQQLTSDQLIEKATLSNSSRSNLYIFKPHTREPLQYRAEVPLYLPKAFNAVNQYYTGKAKQLSETGKMQFQNLRLTSIDISHTDFTQAVADHYLTYNQLKTESGFTPNTLKEYHIAHQHLWNRLVDFNTSRGKALYDFVSEDRFGNRFHSIITQLPKFIKSKGVIKLHKEDTVELDLHQSQPCILAHILQDIDSSNDFSKTFHAEPDIYEYMMNRFSLSSRDAAKKMMFTMLFGKPHGKQQEEFRLMFPKAASIIKQIKTTKINENPSSKLHSNMAFKLQRYESKMFREVWKALHADRIRFLSVHDSVLVQKQHTEHARDIMSTVLSHHLTTFEIN